MDPGVPEPPLRARRRTAGLVFGGLLGLIVAAASLQGLRLMGAVGEHPTQPVRGLSEYFEGPRNVLVLGSDTRANLPKSEQEKHGSPKTVTGERSDTIILMHFDPGAEKAVMVHFPRDLRVPIPKHGVNRINAAFTFGGPTLAVRTVERFTGLPIHNYVEVGLAGFQNLVDTLGGVTICVDRPMFDELANLHLRTAGCHDLNGKEALAFVRARHIEGDRIPDFSRIARQQQFMRAVLNKLITVGSLLDTEVIRTAARQVTTDEGLSAADLVFLGTKVRELAQADPSGASTLDFRVVPGAPETIDGVSYVVAQQPQAGKLFAALKRGEPLGEIGRVILETLPSPAQIRVQVMPMGGVGASADDATQVLRQAGFIVLNSGNPPIGAKRSEVIYRQGLRDRGLVVSGFFPGLPVRQVPPRVLGDEVEVAVVTGRDYRSVSDVKGAT